MSFGIRLLALFLGSALLAAGWFDTPVGAQQSDQASAAELVRASTNERSEVWVDHQGIPVVFRQIVGILARRVVCRVKPGAELKGGERFGIMKFGSRMDVFLPLSADLRVEVGDRVVGGVTVIAELRDAGPQSR